MLDNKAFGALIASRRREIGLTQDAFAAMLGITPQAISKWENGVGYPDVTLFPDIARSLDVSLEMLFGTQVTDTKEEEPVSVDTAAPTAIPLLPNVPPEHCSLPPVAAGSHFICYSDKVLAERGEDADIVRFTDGSCADLASGEVENCGSGEIRLLPVVNGHANHPQRDDAPQTRTEDFLYFHSIQLLCRGSGEVTVKTSPDGQGHMEARGPADFLESVSALVKDETLTLEIAPNGSGDTKGREIIVWLPVASGGQLNAHITGCCKVNCEPAFSHTAVNISGCGELHGSRTQTMTAAISGCGNIHLNSAEDNTSITVSGCGEAVVDYAANPHVNISGSGEVTLRRVSGSMSVAVGGSGDVTAAGELDSFSCHLDGAGTIYGEQLSVSEATIVINSTGTVRLGRIRSHSKEKLGQAATLHVAHRGNPVGGTAHLPLK
ncbi:MAG: DUF2807 domain-containing protein [Clostridia bacterium]|nr:DUF2807 domain-containing protein [Clostridia bacterium]